MSTSYVSAHFLIFLEAINMSFDVINSMETPIHRQNGSLIHLSPELIGNMMILLCQFGCK